MDFSRILKQLLAERNLKQADLCRLAQIQTSLMSEYISGRKSPTLKNAIQIADALNISLDKLAGREDQVYYYTPIENPYGNQMNECMDGLTENERTFIIHVVKAMREDLNDR